MKHRMPWLALVFTLAACEASTGSIQPSPEPKVPSDIQLPVVSVSLNRIMGRNDGLLSGVDRFGQSGHRRSHHGSADPRGPSLL